MPALTAYLFVGAAAAAATFVLVPLARLVAVRYGAVVAPDDRHVHLEPTPTAGGVAMLLGALVAVAVASKKGVRISRLMLARNSL